MVFWLLSRRVVGVGSREVPAVGSLALTLLVLVLLPISFATVDTKNPA